MGYKNPFDEQFDHHLKTMQPLQMGVPRMLAVQCLAAITEADEINPMASLLGQIVSLCVELERTWVELGMTKNELAYRCAITKMAEERLIGILSELGPVDLDAILEGPK